MVEKQVKRNVESEKSQCTKAECYGVSNQFSILAKHMEKIIINSFTALDRYRLQKGGPVF